MGSVYQWFSDNDWFRPSLLGHPDSLQRAHLLAMHQYRAHHERMNGQKARHLIWAYFSLLLCVGSLAAGLIASRL